MRQPIFHQSSNRLLSRNSRDLIEILDSTDQNCMKIPLLILMAALISIFFDKQHDYCFRENKTE